MYIYISVSIYIVSYVLMFVSAVPSQGVLTRTINNQKRLKSVCKGIAVQICKVGGVLWGVNVIVSYCTSKNVTILSYSLVDCNHMSLGSNLF